MPTLTLSPQIQQRTKPFELQHHQHFTGQNSLQHTNLDPNRQYKAFICVASEKHPQGTINIEGDKIQMFVKVNSGTILACDDTELHRCSALRICMFSLVTTTNVRRLCVVLPHSMFARSYLAVLVEIKQQYPQIDLQIARPLAE